MRSRLVVLASLVSLLVASSPAAAEDSDFRIGAGINLSTLLSPFGLLALIGVDSKDLLDGAVLGSAMTNVSIPMRIGRHALLEPQFGFFRDSSESSTSSPAVPGSTAASTTSEDAFSATTLGLGGFYVMSPSDVFDTYVGARLAVQLFSETTKSTNTTGATTTESTVNRSQNNISVAAGAGGEYFISHHFTLGAEVEFGMTFSSKPKFERTPDAGSSGSSTGSHTRVSTTGLVLLRWYFN